MLHAYVNNDSKLSKNMIDVKNSFAGMLDRQRFPNKG